MGWNFSWIAVRGISPAAVREHLGLAPTGEFEECLESDYDGVEITGGWYVVVARALDFIDRLPLDAISRGAEAIVCMLSETVMVSYAASFRDGTRVWRVDHPEIGGGAYRLIAEGDLPESYPSIHECAIDRQAEANRLRERVDYVFDVPVHLAHAVTGFIHDDVQPAGTTSNAPFEILERSDVTAR